VSTLTYAPFAVFCLVSPVLTIAFAYAGIRMPRVPVAEPHAVAQPASLHRDK
jgi:NhaC family Na+:H+ antiporter